MRHSRRDFLKLCAVAAVGFGFSGATHPLVRETLAASLAGELPTVFWLQGQACTGCTVSLLNTTHPTVANLMFKIISLAYHPTLMAAEGELAWDTLSRLSKEKKGSFVLVVEGSVPTAWQGKTCVIAEAGGHHITMAEAVGTLAPNAALVLNYGTCSAYGGIPAAHGSKTGALGVGAFLAQLGVNAPLLNVPGCPPHPAWMIGSLVLALQAINADMLDTFLKLETDPNGRLRWLYPNVHMNCPYLKDFEAGNYSGIITDKNGCRYTLGCKGPYSACNSPKTKWNGGVNWCIGNGICVGCTAPGFPDSASPFYQNREVVW